MPDLSGFSVRLPAGVLPRIGTAIPTVL